MGLDMALSVFAFEAKVEISTTQALKPHPHNIAMVGAIFPLANHAYVAEIALLLLFATHEALFSRCNLFLCLSFLLFVEPEFLEDLALLPLLATQIILYFRSNQFFSFSLDLLLVQPEFLERLLLCLRQFLMKILYSSVKVPYHFFLLLQKFALLGDYLVFQFNCLLSCCNHLHEFGLQSIFYLCFQFCFNFLFVLFDLSQLGFLPQHGLFFLELDNGLHEVVFRNIGFLNFEGERHRCCNHYVQVFLIADEDRLLGIVQVRHRIHFIDIQGQTLGYFVAEQQIIGALETDLLYLGFALAVMPQLNDYFRRGLFQQTHQVICQYFYQHKRNPSDTPQHKQPHPIPPSLQFIIIMQKFIKYAKRPSNMADYWGIFDREARFKFERPPEVQRKAFFEDQFQNLIMGPFYHHLRKNNLLPGGSEAEITNNLENANFDHDQFVFAFSSWLQQNDTVFVYMEKQKQEVKPTPPPSSQNYATPLTQGPQQAPRPPSSLPKQTEGNKKIFDFQKVKDNPTPQKQGNVVTSYQTTQNQIRQMNDKKIPPQLSNPYSPGQQEQRPFAVRFRQKLSDYFEYPERIVSIRSQMAQVFQSQRK